MAKAVETNEVEKVDMVVPGKRIKTLHRHATRERVDGRLRFVKGAEPLKSYAARIADGKLSDLVDEWKKNKKPTRKAGRARLPKIEAPAKPGKK